MTAICVYLGARTGNHPALFDSVAQLGKQLAIGGHRLVYGGSSKGLMGHLALSAMHHGGKVTGIITKHLIKLEEPFDCLDELILTDTMQERKLLLQQRADAFIVVPGGLGTLEEAFETWNAIKIGLFDKPIGFFNRNGFFDSLITFVDHCVDNEFLTAQQAAIPLLDSDPLSLLSRLLQTVAQQQTNMVS